MRIGILGGGQLGKMLALSGYPLGLSFHFYDPDTNCCAREIAPIFHADFSDQDALTKFANSVDIITYENENIPVTSMQWLQTIKPIFPSIKAIEITQDRLLEKKFLTQLNIPTTPFLEINALSDVDAAAKQLGFPFIIKTRRHGYDGKGQVVVKSEKSYDQINMDMLSSGCIAEAWVHYRREFSVLSVSSASSEAQFYDLCENVHQQGILFQTRNIQHDVALNAVKPYIQRLLNAFSYHGVMTVEFFEDQHGHYLVNEIAPRVHNSGHWTIEGAYTSQFQNHLRAGMNWPLGRVESFFPIVMENIISTYPSMTELLLALNTFVHFYGKSERTGRKLGHITRIISR